MEYTQAKYRQMIREALPEVNLVIECVDSRMPWISRSEWVETITREQGKKLLICMTKADLIPSTKILLRWKQFFKKHLAPAIFISSQQWMGTRRLRLTIKRMSKKNQVNKILVTGIPNTGKSSLINVLKGKRSAPVGAKAGFTTSIRWVKITNDFYFIDTPGVAPPSLQREDELAFVGAINPEDLEDPVVAFDFAWKRIMRHHPRGFLERYDLAEEMAVEAGVEQLLEHIARRRGLLGPQNTLLIEEAARLVIRELQQSQFRYYELPPRRPYQLSRLTPES